MSKRRNRKPKPKFKTRRKKEKKSIPCPMEDVSKLLLLVEKDYGYESLLWVFSGGANKLVFLWKRLASPISLQKLKNHILPGEIEDLDDEKLFKLAEDPCFAGRLELRDDWKDTYLFISKTGEFYHYSFV